MSQPGISDWIGAARLRTLPLSLSSIFMGSFLAAKEQKFGILIFVFAVLTTVFLQILSNFANDYGDSQNGADNQERKGPQRAVQSGFITPKQMFTAVIAFGVLSFISGVSLIYISFGGFTPLFIGFLIIGILAILAAYFYTAGKKPYGYAGLGDISVFIFFGIVGVFGSNFLFTQELNFVNIFPAIACGALATGVLNINNIRDIKSDKIAGKITIPVRLGERPAKQYHWFLLNISIISTLFYVSFEGAKPWYLLAFPLILLNGIQVSKSSNPDPYLKTLSLTTLLFVVLFGISII
jgi:1,4-dihydroxy-2-naphthoate octaprenyltransferase